MDPKIFKACLEAVAVVVQHADALSADKRRVLIPREDQPLIAVKILDKPHDCAACNRHLERSPVLNYSRREKGWRTHCDGCNRVRQPGTDYFGQAPDSAAPRANRLGPRPELLPAPTQPQLPEHQLDPTASDPSDPVVVGFVDQVSVQDYRESVITEYSRIPIWSRPDKSVVPVADNEAHKD